MKRKYTSGMLCRDKTSAGGAAVALPVRVRPMSARYRPATVKDIRKEGA